MNKPKSRRIASAIAVSLVLACAGTASADVMTMSQYTLAKQKIVSDFKSDKANCGPTTGNTRDVCMAEANARESIAMAELEVAYKPSVKATRDASDITAKARFAVAKQKCQPQTGNAKDICMKEAELVRTKALADAKEIKTEVTALNTASDKKDKATTGTEINKANSDADKKVSDARAQSEKSTRQGEYKLAVEKCDDFSGNQKDICVNNAKSKYGK